MKNSKKRKTFLEELQGTTDEIIRQIKQLIREGNARRLMIQNKKGKILFQTQLTAGLAGSALLTFMAPIISALGMFALVMNDVKVVVEKYPEDERDKDEYEVEAEVIIDIDDEEEIDIDDEEKPKESTKKKDETKTDKTVGKEKADEDK